MVDTSVIGHMVELAYDALEDYTLPQGASLESLEVKCVTNVTGGMVKKLMDILFTSATDHPLRVKGGKKMGDASVNTSNMSKWSDQVKCYSKTSRTKHTWCVTATSRAIGVQAVGNQRWKLTEDILTKCFPKGEPPHDGERPVPVATWRRGQRAATSPFKIVTTDGFGLQPTTLVEDGSAAAAATAPRTSLFVPSLGTPRGAH